MIQIEVPLKVPMNCVIFVANRGYALISSRKLIIQHFLSSGWKVVIATADDADSRSLHDMGAYLEPVTFNRGGLALAADLSACCRLLGIYRKWRPALIHHFHAKPVIFGSLAARWALGNTACVVNTITGLGYAFTNGGLLARLAGIGYRLALLRTAVTIFQNKDDLGFFLGQGWVSHAQARLIVSSGVNTKCFPFVDRKGRDSDRPIIIMLSRLLRQKGILEFIEVARRIHQRWPKSRFLIAGEEDSGHPDSVSAEWIHEQKDVEFLGRLSDVVPVLIEADLFLFPSYYREGAPRVVLEAAATGLPTVGFDVPGVREVVLEGQTGYLVPDVVALTDRVALLLENESLRLRLGREARDLIVSNFDIQAINAKYVQIYSDLGLKIKT